MDTADRNLVLGVAEGFQLENCGNGGRIGITLLGQLDDGLEVKTPLRASLWVGGRLDGRQIIADLERIEFCDMRTVRRKGIHRVTIVGKVSLRDCALPTFAVINMDLHSPADGKGRIWFFEHLAEALDMARSGVTLSRLPGFLDVVSMVFDADLSEGDERSFMRTILTALDMNTEESAVISYIIALAELGVVIYDRETSRHRLNMTLHAFKETYGVRLHRLPVFHRGFSDENIYPASAQLMDLTDNIGNYGWETIIPNLSFLVANPLIPLGNGINEVNVGYLVVISKEPLLGIVRTSTTYCDLVVYVPNEVSKLSQTREIERLVEQLHQ